MKDFEIRNYNYSTYIIEKIVSIIDEDCEFHDIPSVDVSIVPELPIVMYLLFP